MIFLSMSSRPASACAHDDPSENSHRSVILGTLATHCLLGVGKKSGASVFRGAVNGDGNDMGTLLEKKRGT